MKIFSTCPCCSSPMLRHFSNHREYWFCRQCWQEMPDLSIARSKNNCSENKAVNLSANLVQRNQIISI